MMKILLPAHVIDRFQFAQELPKDIEKFVSKNAIPLAYGGEKKFLDKNYLQNGCRNIKELQKSDFLVKFNK